LASGTGSTQSGLLAGLDKYQIDATVIGISVGRKAELARTIVKDFYVQLCREYRITCKYKSSIVLDQYLCGGYGKFNAEISDLCDNSIKDFGFILDTCYSGKAFYGMMDYMEQNNINKKNVLFWHTGGIFNFLAD